MRTPKERQTRESGVWLLLFLAWLVYTFSYFGKVNYSANITQIIEFYGVSKTQAGAVPTFFFFSYGIGQVVHGIFCKRYCIKWTVFFSLTVSSAINFILALRPDFSLIKWLWLINGFVLSLLWPTLIRMLSERMPRTKLGTSSVVMGTTVAVGTLVIYGLSSVYAALNCFQLSFYTAAFSVFAVAVIWLLFYQRYQGVALEQKEESDASEIQPKERGTQSDSAGKGSGFLATVSVLCFCAIGVNLIKDGLTTWVPSILKEEFGMNDALSILLTLFLPVLAIFGNVCALKLHKKIPDYVNHCALVFAVIAVLIGMIIGSLVLEWVAFMLIGLVSVNFLASSLNSLITSIFPLFMKGRANSGFFAGVLNGFCYVGSTVSSYGLGAIADRFGWIFVFWALMAFCALAVLIWMGYRFYVSSCKEN